jgi:hypothetical protein
VLTLQKTVSFKVRAAIWEDNVMSTVNPVQTTTYYLTPANNPIVFGTGTDINASSYPGDGVFGASTQSWSVTNAGSISGNPAFFSDGVHLEAGGSVTNEAGATISGGVWGVYIGTYGGAGTVTNAGKISGQGGVSLNAGGSVTNEAGATISGNSNFAAAGVTLFGGGTVTNEAGATISAYGGGFTHGVYAFFYPATVQNSGDIVSNGDGVGFISGGVVNNGRGGLIRGANEGVYMYRYGGPSSVTNAGAISGNVGVFMTDFGTGATDTVTNLGAISGTTASVQFGGSGANTLTLQTGSTLIGDAIGSIASGATNALILQGHGTANNDFDNFNALNVQANGNWTLGGDSTFGATSISMGTLVVAGDVSGGATTLGDPAKLVIASTGTWGITDDSGISASASSLIANSGLMEKTGGSGTSAIAPQLVNSGSVLVSSGALDLKGAVSGNGTDTISGASTLEFDSTVGGAQTAGFTGHGTLDLIDPLGFAARISDFAATDKVELSGDWIFSSFSETGNGNMGTLTLSSGSNHLSLHFLGEHAASDFTIASGATTIISHT